MVMMFFGYGPECCPLSFLPGKMLVFILSVVLCFFHECCVCVPLPLYVVCMCLRLCVVWSLCLCVCVYCVCMRIHSLCVFGVHMSMVYVYVRMWRVYIMYVVYMRV